MKKGLFLILFFLSLTACSGTRQASNPSIEFTKVPVAGDGDPTQIEAIEGRVSNAEPGQKIVLYAHSGVWWVQPKQSTPFTEVQTDLSWKNYTHLGKEYAALLVEPGYSPQNKINELPQTGNGVLAVRVATGTPDNQLSFWQTWWFMWLCLFGGGALVAGMFQLRVYQVRRQMEIRFEERLEERLAERQKIAHELHDTLLQGVYSASIQLDFAAGELARESDVKPVLDRVVQQLGQVMDEGRQTLRGLHSRETDKLFILEDTFTQLKEDLDRRELVDFNVVIKGSTRPVRPLIRDDIFRIGREAITNAFRHSAAKRIEAEVDYAPRFFTLTIRDDGSGLDPGVGPNGRRGHFGLSGMRACAERIGAKIAIENIPGGGVTVQLKVPGYVAYENATAPGFYQRLKSKLTRKVGKSPGENPDTDRRENSDEE